MEKVFSKKNLVEVLYESTDLTKTKSTEIVNLVFDTISKELEKGTTVDIKGFGKFDVRKRSARQGINPLTKEPIKIKATKVPGFKASKTLKDLVK